MFWDDWRQNMKRLAAVLLTLAAIAFCGPLSAQGFPNKPVRLIVPFPPGGAADLIARSFGVKLGEALGQPVLIDNRPGADTIIGMDAVAHAPADGYTLILAINSALSMNPSLYAKLPYDDRSFAPISIVASAPLALVVPTSSPANTAAELGAMVKSKPDAYSYGAGNMVARIGAQALLGQSGGRAVAVMYKGSAPTVMDVMRGEVQFAFEPAVVVAPHIKAGKLKALAVASAKRSPVLPDVPTMAESGMPGFDIPVWFGFMAPAATPRAVIARLQTDIARAAQSPEVKEKLAAIGVEVSASTPEEFASAVAMESAVWTKRIKDYGIKVE